MISFSLGNNSAIVLAGSVCAVVVVSVIVVILTILACKRIGSTRKEGTGKHTIFFRHRYVLYEKGLILSIPRLLPTMYAIIIFVFLGMVGKNDLFA